MNNAHKTMRLYEWPSMDCEFLPRGCGRPDYPMGGFQWLRSTTDDSGIHARDIEDLPWKCAGGSALIGVNTMVTLRASFRQKYNFAYHAKFLPNIEWLHEHLCTYPVDSRDTPFRFTVKI